MSSTPNLQLPFLDANQNQKHVTHNASLSILDVLLNCNVISTTIVTPPASPGDGQCWIVGPGGAGAWAGKNDQIAAWQDGSWNFYAPKTGFTAFADNLGMLIAWTGSAWGSAAGLGGASGGGSAAATAFVQALIFG